MLQRSHLGPSTLPSFLWHPFTFCIPSYKIFGTPHLPICYLHFSLSSTWVASLLSKCHSCAWVHTDCDSCAVASLPTGTKQGVSAVMLSSQILLCRSLCRRVRAADLDSLCTAGATLNLAASKGRSQTECFFLWASDSPLWWVRSSWADFRSSECESRTSSGTTAFHWLFQRGNQSCISPSWLSEVASQIYEERSLLMFCSLASQLCEPSRILLRH